MKTFSNFIYSIIHYFKRLPMRIRHGFKDIFLRIYFFFKHFSIKRIGHNIYTFFRYPNTPVILYKMLVKSFFYWCSISLGLFILIYCIFDFFIKLDDYLRASVSTFHILYITVLLIPKGIGMTLPVASMFGIIMSLASLYQNNELIAIFTAGISIYKFVIPVIIINLFLSIGMIFIDSNLVIPAYRYRENLFEHITNKSEKEDEDITIKGENNYFWNVKNFVSSRNMLQGIILFRISDTFRVNYRLDASSALYTKDGWLFRSGTIREWDEEGNLINEKKFHKTIINDVVETPVIFKNVFKKSDYDIEKMTIPEAKARVNLLASLGIEHNKELLNYYKKFSFQFTILVVCLFAIGVSTVFKRNIIILALFFSVGISILYYVAQLILDVLASSGRVPPLIAAWLSIFIFIPVAIMLVKNAKT